MTRAGRQPRIGIVLAILLPLAVLALWRLNASRPGDEFTLGGPLLPYAAAQIEGLNVTHDGVQYRLESREGRWSLTGGVVDFVDDTRVSDLLSDLVAAAGGALLPGTEPLDRRYEFNGSEAVRLTVFGPDGSSTRLALGATNPVTGQVYASGAGRAACFPVEAAVRDRLRKLPDAIRIETLLPGFSLRAVTEVDIEGGTRRRLVRRDGGWWLLWPHAHLAGLNPAAAEYQRLYEDRRWSDAQGDWIRASDDAVSLAVFRISSSNVRGFVPPGEVSSRRAQWGLDSYYRRVELRGEQLNPLPDVDASLLRIDFGASIDGEYVAALRGGNLVLTDDRVLEILEGPASDLVSLEALSFPVLRADSLSVVVDGNEVLAGHRDQQLFEAELAEQGGDVDRVEGRRSWKLDRAAVSSIGEDASVRIRTLAVVLDRLPLLTAFPPTATPDALQPANRAEVRISGDFAGQEIRAGLIIGTLDPTKLPAGSPAVRKDPEGGAAVALWRSDTGQLLQVPASLLASLRNLAH